ncbi:MAG: tetratricopeptide repeat protein [Spirochaetales bacterium]|jgi:tetratricopeptide (TPR) repeat protein|nr:tetratricopeptide repeat protein [Exilispira sp.]NMC66987.1 tetratricopeptide repeat protein [Spirochaetales bacterium]
MDTNQFYSITTEIDNLVKNNRLSDAIKLAEEELAKNQDNPVIYSILGELYESIDFNRSIEAYKKGLSLFPENSYLLIGLGFVYYNKNHFSEALQYFKLAWFNDPMNIRLITAIGNIHRNLKDYFKAEKFYKLATTLEKENVFALFGLADCYRGLNLHSKALEIWLQLAQIEPENKIFLTRIGDAYRMLKEYDKALSFYDRAINIEYDFYAYLGKALTYEQMGNIQKSVETFNILESREKDNSRFYYEYIKFCLRNSMKDKAKSLYTFATKNFPDNRYIALINI